MKRILLRAALGALSASVLLAAWIASAPPGSNPDGGFHLVSIWCAEGTNETDCVRHPTKDEVVLVPRAIEMSSCFAFDPLATGACAQQFYDSPIALLGEAYESNLTGARPQLFYRFMHLFKGDDVLASIMTMRAVNAGIAILLLLGTSLVASPAVRRGLHAAWLATSVPVGLWLLSTTNTGSWIVIGAGTAWANAATATDPRVSHRRRLIAGMLAAVGTLMALGSRTEAIVPLGAAALALVVIRFERLRSGIRILRGRRAILSGGLVLLALLAVVALLPRTAQLEAPLASLAQGLDTLRERGAGDPLLHLILTVPSLLVGGLGVGWGLGWIDTLVPVPVGALAMTAWVSVLIAALPGMTRRGRSVTAGLAVVAFAFPLLTQAYYGLFVSEQFQPRHFLVPLYLILGFAVLETRREALLSRGQRVVLTVGLSLAHAIMLHQQIRRYVTGLRSQIHWDLARDASWWWPDLGVGPTAVWIAGTIAFTVVATILSRDLSRPLPPEGSGVRRAGGAAARSAR